eukprot:3940299-Rhodomonas_salina.2
MRRSRRRFFSRSGRGSSGVCTGSERAASGPRNHPASMQGGCGGHRGDVDVEDCGFGSEGGAGVGRSPVLVPAVPAAISVRGIA